jgi:hypothetical protein
VPSGFSYSTVIGDINPFDAFNAEQNVLVNDATGFAIYTTWPGGFSASNPAFAGADLRILVGQVTTTGTITGQFYLQAFQNGDQAQEWRGLLPILTENPFEPPVPGCTDVLACNFDAAAEEDNGSCVYPDLYLDCAGNCLADADGDGICNPLEVPGCQDVLACNFNPAATDEDEHERDMLQPRQPYP